jgi:shikimate dehydrogenase
MYAAEPTAFMHQALADGARQAHDGLGMLVGQAAESFYLWHGMRPETGSVLKMIRAELDASRIKHP